MSSVMLSSGAVLCDGYGALAACWSEQVGIYRLYHALELWDIDVENAIAADPLLDVAKTDYYSVRDDLDKTPGRRSCPR
ncbi:hypothetical protein ABZ402_31270 [Streptomyces mirabilis]|uniref:hypothetical protein n=1 Tax=Streptomyces mirabilis TaxID=68239 RepID=UPI0033D231A7